MQFWKTAFEDSGRFLGTDWQGPGTHVSRMVLCWAVSPTFDLPCSGSLVQAFHVPAFTNV